jgi:hypothetical protein
MVASFARAPDKAVCFHCSNLRKHFSGLQEWIFRNHCPNGGKENPFGTCVGLVKAQPVSFARSATDDTAGKVRGYVGEGGFMLDP